MKDKTFGFKIHDERNGHEKKTKGTSVVVSTQNQKVKEIGSFDSERQEKDE